MNIVAKRLRLRLGEGWRVEGDGEDTAYAYLDEGFAGEATARASLDVGREDDGWYACLSVPVPEPDGVHQPKTYRSLRTVAGALDMARMLAAEAEA